MDIGNVDDELYMEDVGAVNKDTKCYRCEGYGHMAVRCATPKGDGKGSKGSGKNGGKGIDNGQGKSGKKDGKGFGSKGCTSNPSVKGFSNFNMVSSVSFSSDSMFPLAGEFTLDGTTCCFVAATKETKFSMPHSMTLFLFWEFLLTTTNRNNRARCSAIPTIARTEKLQPNVPRDECQALL